MITGTGGFRMHIYRNQQTVGKIRTDQDRTNIYII